MSNMVKLYDEIFKLMVLIDSRWEDIIARKDNEITVGSYIINKKYEDWDDNHKYWKVSIGKPFIYTNRILNIISFYERGESGLHNDVPCNISTHGSLVLSKYNDTVMINKKNEYGSYDEYNCTIPYDRSCSTEERKFIVDLSFESECVREMLKRMIDFQSMELKHVDLIAYAFELFAMVSGGFVYNELISRPFFKSEIKK